MLNIKVVSWSLAVWTVFIFVFCVAYGLATPESGTCTSSWSRCCPGSSG
jgi:hypothetical protein